MAYDQNSIPKDLRPLNIMRNMPEEQRISPANSSGRPVEGYYASPPTDGSPGTIPTVYYPATIQDSGFVPLGINNGVTRVAGWVQQIAPPPQIQKGVSAAAAGGGQGGGKYTTTSPNYDHTSDEGCGGDDAVSTSSCRKVKFLCSFGGKILPRLSDGALRYVGGQTRIINIGTDILFGDFVKKMAETYVENVVIKYQLPEEDLDALVSVSCSDDLDNMMDEYDKLTERCSDGSSFAKLRIFLFSPSDLDSIGDLHDSGQKYVEAVNGIGDAFTATNNYTDCIARNESIESTVSTQNSDLSGDSLTHGVGEIISLPCNSNNNGFSHRGPKIINYVDSNPLPYAESCAVPLMVKTSTNASLGAVVEQQEVERSVPLSIPQAAAAAAVMSYPASASPFMQTYADSHQESLNNASNYVQIPPQMGFPTQILGTVRQVFTQQAAPPQQQYMTMNPSFISMRPNVVPAVVQSSVRVENYPTETAVMPPRVVQGYNMNPPSNQGSRYGWPTEECQVCQKASPNAHSEEKGSPSSTISDASSVSGKIQGEGQSVYKVETPESSKTVPQGVVHLPYGVFVASNNPASSQNLVLQPQPQPQPQTQPQLQPMPLSNDFGSAVGMVVQKEQSPMEYYSPKVDDSIPSMAYENIRQVEAKLDSMRINSSEVVYTSTADNVSGSSANSDAESSREAERIFNEWNDSLVWSQPRISTGERDGNEGLVPSTSSHGVGDILDHLSSQFINYPPPRPSKLQTKRENADPLVENRPFSSGETPSVVENSMDEYGTYQLSRSLNWDISPDRSLSNKGSVEEQMKKEVQEAAEGVAAAASALHFSVSSSNEPMVNPGNDPPQESHQSRGSQSTNVETEQKRDTFDEIRNRLSERINFGLPASSIGRLQIIKNNDLEELRELGSGTFGTVYHGKWRGTDVAIKRINDRCFSGKPSEQERMRDDFWNEAIKLADLHHPNVVAFYGVVLDGPDGSVATVTEYMVNGSLRNALQRNDRILDKRKRLMIGMDVAFGMEYLHGKNIVHFDLKSDNLLVNLRDPHRPICKVGDLGLSKVKCQTLISGGVRGTLPWMAPELLNGSSSLVSEKVDVFSFGIVMWELVTGEEPYADLHYGAIIGGIVSNTLRPPVADGCDSDWRSLMERCWSSEPSERPNFTIIADELRAMAFKLQAKPQHSPNSQPKS